MKKKGATVQNDFNQIFKGLKSSLKSEDHKESIENNSIDESNNNLKQDIPMKENSIGTYSIDKKTIDNKSIENKNNTKSGIHMTSIRIVKEELMKAMGGQSSAEIKIGNIVPSTGLTRRTVDRVFKYLEKIGDFSFERLHRGMKVTNFKIKEAATTSEAPALQASTKAWETEEREYVKD